MVALKVRLHVHPGKMIRVRHKDMFLYELPHMTKEAKQGRDLTLFDPGVSFWFVSKRHCFALWTTGDILKLD